MNIVLWGAFYLVLTGILVYFFIKEKFIVEWLKNKEEKIAKKLDYTGEKKKLIPVANILTFIHILLAAFFFYMIIKSGEDLEFGFKKIIIFGIFGLNFAVLALRKKQSWGFIANALLLALGKFMIDLKGVNIHVYLGISVVLFLIEIYLYQDKIFESIHLIETSATAIIIVLLIQNFYFGNFMIPTGSMRPTIMEGDRFFANMFKYKFKEPERGDIIAFKEPKDNKLMYTKRLVGKPGETLEIGNKGELVINGKEITMPARLVDKAGSDMWMTDDGLIVLGFTNGELINFKVEVENPGQQTITSDKKGNVYLDGKIVPIRVYYRQEGFFMKDSPDEAPVKVYIPKKGDKIKIDKIIREKKGMEKIPGTNQEAVFIIDKAETITLEDFNKIISRLGTKYKEIIYSDSTYKEGDSDYNYLYSFTLKVEGREELVLPILDMKYNDELMKKLLAGETLTLDHDYYFAMGDNSGNSNDSRYWGYVQDNRIKGKLLVRFFPVNKIGMIK